MNYKDAPGLNQSSLKEFAADPYAYWLRREGKLPARPETKEMEFGRNLEAYLRGGLDRRIVTIPESVLTANGHRRGKAWEAWRADQPEDAILKREIEIEAEIGAFRQCQLEISAHPLARRLIFSKGQWNYPVYWRVTHDLGDIDCKAEIDRWLPQYGIAVDLKTCRDASPPGFMNQAEELGYAIQQAWYTEGLWYAGHQVEAFYFVAVANTAPHAVEVYQLDADWMAAATTWIERWVKRYSLATRENQWRPPTWGRVNLVERPRRGVWIEEAQERWWSDEGIDEQRVS
jgi:hypothetical protein